MSGTDAAATLSLKIDTHGAKADLEALKNEYISLRAVMRDGLPKFGDSTLTSQFKEVQASLSAVSAGVYNVNRALDDIVAAGGKYTNGLVRGAKEATAAVTALNEAVKANASAAQAANNAATTRLLKERAEAATLAAEAERRLAQASAASISAAQASSNAATTRLLKERAEAATLAAEAERRLEVATRSNTAAAQAAYAANQQRLVQDRVKGGSSYNSLMNTSTSISPPVPINSSSGSLVVPYSQLPAVVKQSTEQQIHWNKVADEAHAAARGLAGSLGTLWITYGQLAPLLAGAAIGSSFIQAAKAGSEFAYQLTFVKALSQETSASLKLLGDSTLNLSRQSLQGPNDIASGYRILAQAGLDVTSSISAMPHVLHLATVGEMEMEQSAVTLIGVLNAFGLSIANVEHVGNVFAKAAALSQTSVQSMTEAMKTASVVGEQYGASLEDTATAITLLAKVNITGTSAGTAYRNMLKELYAPVPAAAEAFKRLGVTTQDAAGSIRPFGDVIFDLKEKLEGFNKGDQIKILQRLFGERGAKEAVAMLSLTKDKWIELRDAINNSDGFMSGVAKELEDTAKGRWAQALNTMKASLIGAFSDMEPAFKSLADSFKELFSDETFITGLKRIVEGMLGLTKALVEAAPAVITLAEAYLVLKTAMIGATVWTAATTAMSGYTAALWAASGAMGPVAKGVTVANTALSFLPAGFAALMSPMGLVVGGLAAAGLAFYLFRDRTAEAMEASTEKVRGFAREAKVLLDEVAMTLHNSSVAMSQSRLSAAQTAVVASNETVDESAKAYLKKYGKGNIAGTAAAVESAEAYVRSATTVNSTGETYTTENAQYKAAVALTQANAATRALQKKFYETQDQVRQKEEAEANLAAIKAGQKPTVPKGNVGDILGKDPKTGSGSNRGQLKDARSILSENLSSALKQEQIQLGREVIGIETQLAAQTISATVAQDNKNAATLTSLENEKKLIEQYLQQARAMKDKVEITKFENDLSENALKIEKQRQQANLDSVQSLTREKVAIEDLSKSTRWFISDMEFEREALDMTATKVSELRVEREKLKALDDLQTKVSRNLVDLSEAEAMRKSIDDKAAAQQADVDFQNSYVGGWKKAYKAWADAAESEAKRAADTFSITVNAMETALDTFLTTGKVDFAAFAKSVILEIAKIEARALLAEQTKGIGGFGGIVKGILGMLGMGASAGTTGSTVAGVMVNGVAGGPMSGAGLHSGGIVGLESTFIRDVPSSTFRGAPKFHSGGIAGDEVPAILKKGEGVFTAKQMQALGGSRQPINITVHVNGNSTAPDVRRSAAQGAREGLSVLNGALRYG